MEWGQEFVYFISHLYHVIYVDVITLIYKAGRMTFKRQKPWVVLYVLRANAPMRISYKTLIRSANKKKTILDYKIIDDCFQQSSQNNALQ